MAQISRPFQVVLAAFVLFAIAWFALLHRPTSETSGGSASSGEAHSATPHGHTVSHSAARHTTASRTTVSHTATHHTTVSRASASHAAVPRPSATGASHSATAGRRNTPPTRHAPTAGTKSASAPTMQATVSGELRAHKVVLLLFWNPSSSDDNAVHRQVQLVAHKLGRSIAVHTATAGQVGAFGSITRDIQVYQTPTLLIVNPKHEVTTVTGYTDAYALEQTIREARG